MKQLAFLNNQISNFFSFENVATDRLKGKADFSTWKFVLLIAFSCLILFLRQPDGILHAQFFAEDGNIFFKGAFELSFWQALITPYNGYFHLIPRLIAELGSLFPLANIPLIYALFSLVFASICLSWFYLPCFRTIVKSDLLRLLLVVLFLAAPNQDSLMKLSYIQWYLVVWASLVTLAPFPKNRWGKGFLLTALTLIFWTAPTTIILLPIWLLRLIYTKNRTDRGAAGFIIVMGSASLIVSMLTGNLNKGMSLIAYINYHAIYTTIRGFFLYTFLPSILGTYLTSKFITLGHLCLYILVILGSLGMLFTIIRSKYSFFINIIIFYIIFASLFLGITVRLPQYIQLFGLHDAMSMLSGCQRYLLLGTMMLYVFIISFFEQQLLTIKSSNIKRELAVLVILAFLGLNIVTFRMAAYPDMQWSKYSKLIYSEQRSLKPGTSTNIEIPINPNGWSINLKVRK